MNFSNDTLLCEIASLIEGGQNAIPAASAIEPSLAGTRIFDMPQLAVGDAREEYFSHTLRSVLGAQYISPEEWLPGAQRAVSLFFPLSADIRKSNRRDMSFPSNAWLHGRDEGHKFIDHVTRTLAKMIEDEGGRCVIPALSPRFALTADMASRVYTSNWSERHAAFGCGIGTFGLHRGIISKKGAAGRLASLITDLPLEITPRYYDLTEIYGNCIMCGKCAKNCPSGAIDIATGKDHVRCDGFLHEVERLCPPRHACGKCQVAVPCETSIPKKIKKEI